MPTNKRARDLERQRLERQARRRAERAARRRRQGQIIGGVVALLVVIGAIVGTLVASHHSGSSSTAVKPAASTTPTPSVTPSASASTDAEDVGTPVCHFAAASGGTGDPGLPADVKATGKHTLTMKLTQGTIVIALSPKAPCTVESFIHLASKNFFTGTTCPRLVTSGIFVLQCGDPKGDGTGSPGYTIPDENLTGATYPAGTVAMANTGAQHTGGSQFFLVYKDSTGALGATYTPFGTITSGLDVLTKIAAAGSNNKNATGDGNPNSTVKILAFTIS